MRYLLILLGLLTAIAAFWLALYTASFSSPLPIIWVLDVLMWIDALILMYVGGTGAGKTVGRIGRLVSLSLDAKEAELKKKAGA